MTATNVKAAAVLAAALLLTMTGCAAEAPSALSRQSTAVSQLAADRVAKPATSAELDCSAAAPEASVTALLGGPAAALSAPPRALSVPIGAGLYAVTAGGGAWCAWADAQAAGSATRTLTIAVLPGGAQAWARLGGETSLGGDDCLPTLTTTECLGDVLVGDTWLSVRASVSNGSIDAAGFHAVVQTATSAAKDFDADAERPDVSAAPDCTSAEWLSGLGGVAGTPLVSAQLGIVTELQSYGLLTGAARQCAYSPQASAGIGTLSLVRSADAAFGEYRRLAVADGGAQSIPVAVAGRSATAIERILPADGQFPRRAVVDALVDGTWIQLIAWDADADRAAAMLRWVAGRV